MAISDREQIKKDIVDQLYWDQSVDASDVDVHVDNGRVTLKGTVPTYSARRAAYTDAIIVPGVKEVDNELVVKIPHAFATLTDEDIRQRVENALAWNADIDATNITVSVDSGYVILDGHVDAYWKKLRAQALASDIQGVRGVEDALSVVLTEKISDQLIADDIMGALKRRLDIDLNMIDVAVKDGVVTFSGTVPTCKGRDEVERAAGFTAGVVDVIDDLEVSVAC